MNRIPTYLLALAIAASLTVPTQAWAEKFSLFGVTMGMEKAALENIWIKGEENNYQVPGSVLFKVIPEFDHRNQMYRLSFSTPIPLLDQYPGPYAATAFQQAVQEKWGSGEIIISIRTGRGIADITLTSKPLQDEYNKHIKAQMEFQLQSILRGPSQDKPDQP
jgi:hypothetical protein